MAETNVTIVVSDAYQALHDADHDAGANMDRLHDDLESIFNYAKACDRATLNDVRTKATSEHDRSGAVAQAQAHTFEDDIADAEEKALAAYADIKNLCDAYHIADFIAPFGEGPEGLLAFDAAYTLGALEREKERYM